MEDTPDAELPPRKRLCLTALTLRYEVEESSTVAPRPAGGHGIGYGFISTLDAKTRRQKVEEVGYGIRDTWVDPRETVEEIAPMTLEGVNTMVTELAAVQEQDTQDIYAVIEDVQDRQTRIFQSVEVLIDDRQYHYETVRLLDQEALVSREAWAHSMGLSSAVHYELQGYSNHAWIQDHRIDAQDSLIAALTAQFLVMPFGLTNAPSTFQALMNEVFAPFLRKFILVFFDDILVYSRDMTEHAKHLELVLKTMQSQELYAKMSKCVFGAIQVEYLGHVISGIGVSTDPSKVKAMQE
ncbi:putative reverse transcriptase domain-containing protein [Tanacetum coccineum]